MDGIEKMLQGWWGRAIRAAASIALAGVAAKYGKDTRYVMLAPVIQAGFKALRDKYPGVIEWLPL